MNLKLRGLVSLSETSKSIVDSDLETIIAPAAALPFILAHQASHHPILVVTHSSKRASELLSELADITENVAEFPAWETLPHERLSPNSDTVAKRISTLMNIDKVQIVVTTARALIQPISSAIDALPLLSLERGNEIEFSHLVSELSARAYNRVDLVERRGDFAVRGGIIDIFPPLSAHPVRIEFFGDEIEEMKLFEIGDQRTFAPIIGVLPIIPCREILITEEMKLRAGKLKSAYPQLREVFSKIEAGIYVEGIESLASILQPGMKSLIDFLPNGFEVINLESERIRSRVKDLIATNQIGRAHV